MNDIIKKIIGLWPGHDYDLGRNVEITQEVTKLYAKQSRKLKIETYLRLAAAFVIIIYGTLGIKYNTGWYVDWALFTALVGVNAAMVILVCHWQMQAKLSLLREIKELRLEIGALSKGKGTNQL